MKHSSPFFFAMALVVLFSFCKKKETTCPAITCQNGGTANATCGCDCPAGYSGANCQTKTCAVISCQNGGTFNSASCGCDCPAGYSGANCQTKTCTVIACQNGGTFNSAACGCDCPTGWTGADCSTAKTPVSIIIDTVWVTGFSMTQPNGTAWDNLLIGTSQNPDIFVKITDEADLTTYLTTTTYDNATNSFWYPWKLATPLSFSPSKVIVASLYDEDTGSSQGMAGIKATLSRAGNPRRVEFSCATCTVKFQFSVRYTF